MTRLEHRIPPPLLAVLIAACMWLATHLVPTIELGRTPRLALAALFALPAALCAGSAFRAFRRARTTIDPLRIGQASSLVTTGIYRLTRNPMYLALTLLLCAWAAWLSAPWTALGPALFAAFITRFQILPEERVLQDIFGRPYADYRRRVGRWI